MNARRIAFLGLGAMGYRVAENLLKAGYKVVIYNRTKRKVEPLLEQGAIYAPTPRAAAEQAEVVISMVTDDQASCHIWLDPETGAADALGSNQIAIESSTLTVAWTQELAAAIQQRGARFLDAPVVGSRPQAEAGKLIYLVGGDAPTLAEVKDIFLATSAAVHHVGPVGQAMALKLAVNALFGIQVAALAETIGWLQQAGINPEQAMACLGELPVTSPAAKVAGSLIVNQQHAPLFPIELVEKDCRYTVATAQSLGAATPVTAAIQQVYQQAIAQGYSQSNITGVAQLY
jgi:3-hydroxyisobutyrate dehydrogenase